MKRLPTVYDGAPGDSNNYPRDITYGSESYPFLGIARAWCCDYADVLACVAVYRDPDREMSPILPPHMIQQWIETPNIVKIAVIQACHKLKIYAEWWR